MADMGVPFGFRQGKQIESDRLQADRLDDAEISDRLQNLDSFAFGKRFFRCSEGIAPSEFHFEEDCDIAFSSDDVDLSMIA